MSTVELWSRLLPFHWGRSSSSTRCLRALKFRVDRARYFSSHRCLGEKQKPYYVTSPIFYVNAEPHAGHLYTLILTDVLKRWHVLRGDEKATLLTGTDEHGMKIQKAAAKANVNVKHFCDKHASQFLNLADKANISYDRFIRTTDPDHFEAVEYFWRELQRRGYIYEAKHEGWYSVSDETFYPESQVHLILDPSTGRKLHASIETGKEVEWTSEMNYHFKLSAFKDRLLQHYAENPNFIVPQSRMNFIIKEVQSGLNDLSISRPASRLSWGIRVPDDESQTIYVWLDALINYLTMTGYPKTMPGESGSVWPPNCQVIGKDIIRFHTVYWPAFLMALDLPLPQQFLSHAHWTMANAKMSKSLGNGVNPFYVMSVYGQDAIRYYMTHDGGIVDDADYDNSYVVEKYKKGLQGGLGNLASRIVRGKHWSVPDAVQQGPDILQAFIPGNLQDTLKTFTGLLETLNRDTSRWMDVPDPRQALRTVMEAVYAANKFFQEAEVWQRVKDESPKAQRQVQKIIFLSAEAVRICCILLQPFMPAAMEIALDYLGVDPTKRTLRYAQLGADRTYGRPIKEPGKGGYQKVLFPPLITEF